MSGKPLEFKLKVIPKPEEGTRTVLVGTKNGNPYVAGNSNISYQCGTENCDYVLLKDVEFGQVSNTVFECPACKNYSEI